MNYCACIGRLEAVVGDQIAGRRQSEGIMRIWLESDAVALAVLVLGIAAIELLAFNI